jgi:hypothetical protein
MMNGNAKGLIMFVLTLVLSSISVYYAFGEYNLWQAIWLWIYGAVYLLILVMAATRKDAVMGGLLFSLSIVYLWYLITSGGEDFINALFLFAVLMVLTFTFLFRKELEQATS